MPPQRSARLAAVAEHAQPLWPLPLALVLCIFSLLPVDMRLRCREVCRAWRAALEDVTLWTRLDLGVASGIARSVVSRAAWNSLLRCAAARAGGGLLAVQAADNPRICGEELARVAALNAGALRELRVNRLGQNEVVGLLVAVSHAAAVLEADVSCNDLAMVHSWLRNEPPYGPLHIRRLNFYMRQHAHEGLAGVLALAADVAVHGSLQEVQLFDADLRTAAAVDAIVDAAVTRRLRAVLFSECALTPASVPALVRLIGGGALTALTVLEQPQLLDVPGATLLGAALRANTRLTMLYFGNAGVWRTVAAGTTLVDALVGHPSLQTLRLTFDGPYSAAGRAAAGAALGMLIAANTPALHKLDVSNSALRNEGLAPIFEALPANTHLRWLDCASSGASEAFVRDALLPAVHANTSLRTLNLAGLNWPSARQAEDFVSNRAAE
jgi:hypothetical protein